MFCRPTGKTRIVGLPYAEENNDDYAILIQYLNVADRQTDRQTDRRT